MSISWLALALAYLTVLFWIARWGDKNTPTARWITSHPLVYTLALGIYCTAWTFFGAVGQASQQQWMYLPIMLGPILVYLLGYRFIYKLIHVSKKQHISTIADFVSSRYGKRQIVALMVTIIALLATIPYIALQLKAIGASFQLITAQTDSQIIIVFATLFIALFAMYFGTRNTDVTQYRRGLILAISFESCIKLLALVLIAYVGFRYWSEAQSGAILQEYTSASALNSFLTFDFWAQTLMAAAAIICLPRQFHVTVIDNLRLEHVATARWMFPLYLFAIALTIPIIAAAGKAIFADQALEADSYVMGIALYSDSLLLQVIVFLGGLSASTAMIIVATLTLSTMITNDVVLPKLMDQDTYSGINRVKRIKLIRRAVIFVILVLSFAYQQQMANQASLASIGLLAFSLVVQLMPAIVGGLYWERGHAHGVYAGLMAGLFLWLMFLFLPMFSGQTLGYSSHLLSQAAIYSLLANIVFYVVFSLLSKPRLIDRIQAKVFVLPATLSDQYTDKAIFEVSVGDLKTLIARFTGDQRCDQLFSLYAKQSGEQLAPNKRVNEDLLAFCERALGGVVGSSSAKALIDSLVRGKKLDITDVVNFFDDTAQAMQFNMSALLTSLENIDQGISVIDNDQRLVAWNKRYTDLFNYPEELVTVGAKVEPLIRHNVLRGDCGIGEVELEVQKRLEHLRNGTPHRFTRQRDDGHVIEMVGNPLPGGGFVTSFHDITGHVEIQQALKETNIDLAARVAKRTEEVHSINAELRLEIERRNELEKSLIRARQEAESANESKTRFLALASHDVLQPLNAAKLYLTALQESDMDSEMRNTLSKLNDSVVSSETLISTILDISRLDQNELKPYIETIQIQEVLTPIVNEMGMKAKEKGLDFRARIQDCWISADKTYFYRIVQNLVSNAVKYTRKGKVLLTVRRQGDKVYIQVRDTGIGIPKLQQAAIFSDFYRVENSDEQGIGLGLSVVKRLSQQLSCQIKVDSIEDKGSCFSIEFMAATPPEKPAIIKQPVLSIFNKLTILCVDDQQENLDAMNTLLSKWGIEVGLAKNHKQALEIGAQLKPHILLVDYQLGRGPDGLEIIDLLRQQSNTILPACLVTAKRGDDLLKLCADQGVNYLAKPLKPAKLRTLIQSMAKFIKNVDVESK
ncbi:PAS domain-containing hybrid sensor histidine kinase/response regulator [Glaciecola sp. 2405UD65-10]|uniref:PAS domain-containing hybrid sensor histidine kinase/response regulator n=1 Tax=Glaciecola sp. 2405UD65-10 TaxID=3397244 RepID=UPI003B59E49E